MCSIDDKVGKGRQYKVVSLNEYGFQERSGPSYSKRKLLYNCAGNCGY